MSNIEQRIKESVHAEHCWKPDEVRVAEERRLRHERCVFFAADNVRAPTMFQPHYALIDGRLLSHTQPASLRTILTSCGEGASASWKANVIVRFHFQLDGVVLSADSDEHIKRKLAALNGFSEPKFKEGTLRFLVFQPTMNSVASVRAIENERGSVSVEISHITIQPGSSLLPELFLFDRL
jgi:hypothetical protein